MEMTMSTFVNACMHCIEMCRSTAIECTTPNSKACLELCMVCMDVCSLCVKYCQGQMTPTGKYVMGEMLSLCKNMMGKCADECKKHSEPVFERCAKACSTVQTSTIECMAICY